MSLKKINPADPLFRNVEEMKKAGERAAVLTRQLLAFSRKQVLEPKVLDLNAIVADLQKMLQRLIGADIEFIVALDPEIARVKADPGQIEQVLMNLAVNARDAMPGGGKLTVQTAQVRLDEEQARHHSELTAGEYVLLSVSDTGTGMTDEVKAHLFEPFFTTKPVGKGTGLGLATCYGIVKQSGGHIAVESELGKGTTFQVYLPSVEPDAPAVARADEGTHLPRGKEAVLLVDDEPALREMAGSMLGDLGYTVLAAANGEEALRMSESHRGEIHLLITDVVMPKLGGKELAGILRTARPAIKTLFASGYAEEVIVQQGVLDPSIVFLQKPFLTSVLARKVREVLDGNPGAH